jgi:hypothetical protein
MERIPAFLSARIDQLRYAWQTRVVGMIDPDIPMGDSLDAGAPDTIMKTDGLPSVFIIPHQSVRSAYL